jgi:hypothetical protein
MTRFVAALAACLLAFTPALAFSQMGDVTGEDGFPTRRQGVRIMGSDGTNDYKAYVDANGFLHIVSETGNTSVVQHWTGKTIGAGVADSSAAAFETAGYRQAYILIRFKNAVTGGAAALAWRNHLGATIDTTGTWYSQIGANTRGGTNITFNASLGDGLGASGTGSYRMYRIALMDSLGTGSVNSPRAQTLRLADWSSIWVKNLSGAAMVVDLWIELLK